MACQLCEGTGHLGGSPAFGLGPCTCVDDPMVEVCEALRLPDDAGLLDRVLAYVEAVDGVFSALTAGAKTQGEPGDLVDAVNTALDAVYDGAAEALSDYLVSIGLPARPAGAVSNPALERLISLIF